MKNQGRKIEENKGNPGDNGLQTETNGTGGEPGTDGHERGTGFGPTKAKANFDGFETKTNYAIK